ncbi:MAG: hypothetical protein M1837_004708 [Sclerophora amabilis]|nr:MAG: hypothetical protein M1837_004708 [Sclerophora amabilis]
MSNVKTPLIVGVAADILSPSCAEVIVTALTALKDSFPERGLHILVNNAALAEFRDVDKADPAQNQRCLKGNVETPILLVQALLPYFRPSSRVVNISSEGSHASRPGDLVYLASKAAMDSMTRTWAQALGRREGMQETTVNSVSVGLTRTELYTQLPEETREAIERESLPLVAVEPRLGEADDIAQMCGSLVSEESRWMTASVLCANGGATPIL